MPALDGGEPPVLAALDGGGPPVLAALARRWLMGNAGGDLNHMCTSWPGGGHGTSVKDRDSGWVTSRGYWS
jgi:hypothetical protein